MKGFIEKLIGRLREEKHIVYEYEHSSQYEPKETEVVDYEDTIEIINQLAEEYNNGWIPCSERLPERDMWCLATFESGGIDKIQYLFLQRWWNGEMGGNRVVAWQPLPDRYEEKG